MHTAGCLNLVDIVEGRFYIFFSVTYVSVIHFNFVCIACFIYSFLVLIIVWIYSICEGRCNSFGRLWLRLGLWILFIADIKTAVKNKVPLVRSLTLNWVTFCIETSNKAVVLKLHKDYVPIFMEVSAFSPKCLMFFTSFLGLRFCLIFWLKIYFVTLCNMIFMFLMLPYMCQKKKKEKLSILEWGFNFSCLQDLDCPVYSFAWCWNLD